MHKLIKWFPNFFPKPLLQGVLTALGTTALPGEIVLFKTSLQVFNEIHCDVIGQTEVSACGCQSLVLSGKVRGPQGAVDSVKLKRVVQVR